MKKCIYLIAYDYHSSFGKLVKMKSNSIYNHAGLSLTRDLHPTYTYVRHGNTVSDKRYLNGFSEEELSDILQKDDKAKMKVIEVEVDEYQYEKAEALIEGFINNVSKTTYDFFNLSTIALNIKRKYYNLPDYSFICSEFVAYIMKEIGRPISDKSVNLILPKDIANADKTMKNAKVIYDGLVSEYMLIIESYLTKSKRPKYDKPYSYEEIVKNYGKETADRLMKDPAHKFRAETGIELIHKEPSLDELNRIYSNYKLMDKKLQKISDKKSMELYGLNNIDHYNKLLKEYDVTESYLMEMKRSELPDSEFGVPEERKYPLDTEQHVYSAIKLFNHVNPKYEAELARNIKRKMKKYNITNVSIGPNNRFGKYYKKGVKESMDITMESSTLYDAPPIKNVIMYKNNGMNNAIVSIPGNNIKLRGRSEVLIFKKDKVYLAFKGDKYRIPGGSWEPNESHADTAIRETQEEVRMNIAHPKYITSYVEEDDKPKQWVIDTIPKNMQWKGYYIDLYIAEYNGQYSGHVNNYDKDNIVNIGKFYNIEDVYNKLNPYHKKAVEVYISDTGIDVNLYDNEVKESMEYLEEAYLLNTDDIYYNKNKFDSGEINLCFITGHSGSGKSTMARNMAKNNIEHYELDDVIYNKEHFSMENFREYGDLIYSFFRGPGKKYYCTPEECRDGRFNGHDYEKELIEDFVNYSIKYAKSHRNKKFVIEGVWLFMNIEPEKLKDYAVYIKGTSALVSTIRASKRDWENDVEDSGDLLKSIPVKVKWLYRRITNDIRNGGEFERKIQKYRDYFSKKVISESYEGNTMDIVIEAKKYEVITDEKQLQKSIDEIMKSKDPNLVKMGKAMDVAIRNDFENPNALLGTINVVIIMGLATPAILLTIISVLAIMASLIPLSLYAKLLTAHRNFLKSRVKPDEITKSYYVALNELIKTGSIETIVVEGYKYTGEMYNESELGLDDYVQTMEKCFVVKPKYFSLSEKNYSFLSGDYLSSNIMTLRQYDIFPKLDTEKIIDSYLDYVNNSIDYILKHPNESPINRRIYSTYDKCIHYYKMTPKTTFKTIFDEYFFSNEMKNMYDIYGQDGLNQLLSLKLEISLDIMRRLVSIHSRLVRQLSEDYIASFTNPNIPSIERQRIVNEVMDALAKELKSNRLNSKKYNAIYMSKYDPRCGNIYVSNETIEEVLLNPITSNYDLDPIRQAIGYSFLYDAVFIGHGAEMYYTDGRVHKEDFAIQAVNIEGTICRSATEAIDKLLELGNKKILLIACNMSHESSQYIEQKYSDTDAIIVIAGVELLMEQYIPVGQSNIICVNVDHYSDPKNIVDIHYPHSKILSVEENAFPQEIFSIKTEMINCISNMESIYDIFNDIYNNYLPVYLDINANFQYTDLYTGNHKEIIITSYQQIQKIYGMLYNQISGIIIDIGKKCDICMKSYQNLVMRNDIIKYGKKSAFIKEELKGIREITDDQLRTYYMSDSDPITEISELEDRDYAILEYYMDTAFCERLKILYESLGIDIDDETKMVYGGNDHLLEKCFITTPKYFRHVNYTDLTLENGDIDMASSIGESPNTFISKDEIKTALEDIKIELRKSYHPVTEAPNEEDEEDTEKTPENEENTQEEEPEQEEPEDDTEEEEDELVEPTTDVETDDEPVEDEAEDTSTDYTDDVTDPDDTGEPDEADDYTTDVDNPDEEDQAEGDDLTATDFTGAVTANVDDEEIETGEPATDETEDQPAAEEPEGDIPEGETGAEDEAGMEEPADFTDGVDGAEGDTGEEPPADETADETGEEPVENEQDNNNLQNSIVKNYNLMIDFQKIYQSIEDILKHLKSVNYTTSIQNSVLDRCINNLTNLKNEVLTYIEYDYSNDYKTNLYYYTTYVQALKIVLEMLRSIQMLNKESNNNLKLKNSKGV